MKYIVDIECDGLLEVCTKIHVTSVYCIETEKLYSLFGRKDITKFFDDLTETDTIIGHNFIRFDARVIEKLCNVKIKAKIIDSLALSWYLYPDLKKHGLEIWGDLLGVAKPKITDWNNLSKEDYTHRCEQDVIINKLLWNKQYQYLLDIYEDEAKINSIIGYLMFKMYCALEQEINKIKLDVVLVNSEINRLETLKNEKIESLIKVMPKVETFKTINKPDNLYKKDGKLSIKGIQWNNLVKEYNISDDEVSITIPFKEGEPNPNSNSQIKNWLYSLGWIPETFKETISKETKESKEVPQLVMDNKQLCPSVIKLIDINPSISHLDGLFTINHRLGVLKGFLASVDSDGYIIAGVAGFTNTLRFKHSILVNLPKPDAPYAEGIRAALTVPNNDYLLCGSDVSGLEDTSKRNFLYQFDPDYVMSQMEEGFDPHLDIAQLAGILTPEQVLEHKAGIKSYKKERQLGKTCNFGATYGAGATKIAKTAGISLDLAKKLHKAYWDRNWSIKKVASLAEIKTINNQIWQLNPINGFWYSLRYEKDKFSLMNQGAGDYLFTSWLKELYKYKDDYKFLGQWHDEILLLLPNTEYHRNTLSNILRDCMDRVNIKLSLNVPLSVSIDFGINYKEVH